MLCFKPVLSCMIDRADCFFNTFPSTRVLVFANITGVPQPERETANMPNRGFRNCPSSDMVNIGVNIMWCESGTPSKPSPRLVSRLGSPACGVACVACVSGVAGSGARGCDASGTGVDLVIGMG